MGISTIRLFPIAYHVTLQAYGQWLPGDPRGWHARGDGAFTPPRPGHEVHRALSRERMRGRTVTITESTASMIEESITEASRAHGWTLHLAVAVVTHLHVVVTATAPGLVVIDTIRKETMRYLIDRGVHDSAARLWSRGGYFSEIRSALQLERAVEYVRRHRLRGPGGDD